MIIWITVYVYVELQFFLIPEIRYSRIRDNSLCSFIKVRQDFLSEILILLQKSLLLQGEKKRMFSCSAKAWYHTVYHSLLGQIVFRQAICNEYEVLGGLLSILNIIEVPPRLAELGGHVYYGDVKTGHRHVRVVELWRIENIVALQEDSTVASCLDHKRLLKCSTFTFQYPISYFDLQMPIKRNTNTDYTSLGIVGALLEWF